MTMKFPEFTEMDHYWHAVSMVNGGNNRVPTNYERLIRARGGKCSVCGVRRGLEFHHTEDDKLDDVAALEHDPKLMKEEAKKCILVCNRCHDLVYHFVNMTGTITADPEGLQSSARYL